MGADTGAPPDSHRHSIAGDVWGGLAAMLVALPSAIGYALYAFPTLGGAHQGRVAMAGLLGAVTLGIVAPAFGGAQRLISAPCGPAAAVLAAFSVQLAAADAPPEKVLLAISLVGVLGAVLQFAYGALGGGRLIKYIPYPVVAGYLSGVGLLLFTGYVPKLLGIPSGVDPWTGLVSPATWETNGLLVGLATIGGMLAAPRITRAVPPVIVGLGCGLAAYGAAAALVPGLRTLDGNALVLGAAGGTASDFVATIADRARAASGIGLGDLGLVLVPALTLSVLLSIDTLKTCVILDTLTRSRHDSNRELRGQGLGNLASAVAGGMPGAGTMGATLVNLASGGTTRLSGVFEGVFAAAAFVLLTGFVPGFPNLIAWFPRAALAGIIMVVSVRMIDRHSLDLLRHRSTVLDFVVVVAVVATALGANLLAASGVGLALAIVLFIREQIRGSVIRRRVPGNRISSKRQRPAEQVAALQAHGGEAVLVQLQGTLFFGTTDQLFSLLAEDLRTRRYVILDMRRVQSLDYTAAHVLQQIEAMLTERDAHLVYCGLPASVPSGQDLREYFRHAGLVDGDRNVQMFDDVDAALEWVEDRILAAAGRSEPPSGPPLALDEFDLFREFDDDTRRLLREAVVERSLAPGEVLFRHGDAGDEMFLVRRGAVDVHLPLEGGRRHRLATFSRGSLLGDMAFLDRGIRSADASATRETDLYSLSRARFDELSRSRPVAGAMLFARLATVLADRLRRTDAELKALEES